VHFRVWAPRARQVDALFEDTGETSSLKPELDGYHSGLIREAREGTCYRFRLDGGTDLYPDPATRFQPDGPFGPSEVIDANAYHWKDDGWRGVALEGQVLYEMHIGTFTRTGTWAAATTRLSELADLGVTVLEVMPVAEFPGRFGWGYDGVNLFAPTRLYGRPDDFRRFVDAAHALGLAVILDVVYNHFGPDGNFLRQFSSDYRSTRHQTEWGEALNFDGPNSEPVRDFIVANAGYWIEEFHLDGLRLDAIHAIFDDSNDHITAAVGRRVRAAAGERGTLVIAENERQQAEVVRPAAQGGFGLDAAWNDDFHHSARVALTGNTGGYYADYRGSAQELLSAIKRGFLFQGQRSGRQKRRRGTPALDVPPARFVAFLENHDQVANSGRGLRPHQLTCPGRWRAMTALLLLAPSTPLLFQGQEFAASTPFLFFADHKPALAALVRKGRADSLSMFRSLALPEMQQRLDDPSDERTFRRCQLDDADRERGRATYALHLDLLRLRRTDPVFAAQRPHGVDGAVIGERALFLRFFAADGGDRLLVVNLGCELELCTVAEPLLAPPLDSSWQVMWTSDAPDYGGDGTAPVETSEGWFIPAEAAVVLSPVFAVDEKGPSDEPVTS
jgi:maltooligosyltrehalose trehalohydrolase